MANEYWKGRKQAVLTEDDVEATWSDVEVKSHSLKLVNRAFCLYYRTMQRAREAEARDSQHAAKIKEDIRDAGRSGFGVGVDDLYECFVHLEANDGTWTSESTNFYSGKQLYPNYPGSLIYVPDAISNFLEAVDSRVDELSSYAGAYKHRGRSVYDKLKRARQLDSGSAWKEVGQGLSGVSTTAKNMERVLWLSPPVWRVTSQTARSVVSAADTVGNVAGKVVTYADFLGNVHAGATTAVKLMGKRGISETEAAAVGTIQVAVSLIPVGGSILSDAVGMAPDLVDLHQNLEEFFRQRHERRSDPDKLISYLKRRRSSPFETCSRCGHKMRDPCA